jgi:hypothetical protein
MKQLFIALIILIFPSVTIFAEDGVTEGFYLFNKEGYCEYDVRLTLGEDYVVIPDYDPFTYEVKGNHTYPCRIVVEDHIPFLLFGADFNKRYVILRSRGFLLLYHTDSILFFEGGCISTPEQTFDMVAADYTASSYLTETIDSNTVSYLPENLGTYKCLEKPWVNTGNRYGIGEKITITFKQPVYRLCFSNGYVSGKKPHLYDYNSRVKKMKVTNLDNAKSNIHELKDNPDIQWINLPDVTSHVEITILEVFAGSRYKDTCINFIVGERYDVASLGPQGYDAITE